MSERRCAQHLIRMDVLLLNYVDRRLSLLPRVDDLMLDHPHQSVW